MNRARLAAAAAAAVAAVAYLPALRAGFVWDDHSYVEPRLQRPDFAELKRGMTQDLYAADPSDAPSGYWRPVTVTTYWLVAALGGGAAAQHGFNIALHALAAALLVIAVTRRLGEAAALPAAMAAGLWALHPLQAETVAWISCRYDLLCAVFALALLARAWGPFACGALFFAGLLSKESFLAAALLVAADDWAERRPLRSTLARWSAVAVAIGAWAALRAALHIGAIGGPRWLESAPHVLSAISIYLGRAVAPLPLTVSHPYAPLGPLGLALGAAALVALALVALRYRSLAPPAALIVGPLALQALAMGQLHIAPERYFHLPSLGIAWLLAAALATLRGRALAASAAACCVAMAVEALVTVPRLAAWKSDDALFAAAAAVDPGDATANLYLGIAAGKAGKLDEAASRLTLAKARAPDDVRVANALAWAHLRRGDAEAAKAEARRAVALNPALPQARLTLATAYHVSGAHLAERTEIEKLVAAAPRFVEGRLTRALARCEIDQGADCEADLDVLAREGALSGAVAHAARVEAALRRGDAALAGARLDAFRAAFPDDPRVAQLQRAREALLARQALAPRRR